MACRFIDTKPLSETLLVYFSIEAVGKHFIQNTNMGFEENSLEYVVCKITTIWFRLQCAE